MSEQDDSLFSDINEALGIPTTNPPDSSLYHLGLYPEDAATSESRSSADYFIGFLLPQLRENSNLTIEEIRKMYSKRKEYFENDTEPLSDFELSHVIGSLRRRIDWFHSLRDYYEGETDVFNQQIQLCTQLKELISTN